MSAVLCLWLPCVGYHDSVATRARSHTHAFHKIVSGLWAVFEQRDANYTVFRNGESVGLFPGGLPAGESSHMCSFKTFDADFCRLLNRVKVPSDDFPDFCSGWASSGD